MNACRGLYRLCMGENSDGKAGYGFLLPTLSHMLVFIDDAQKMKSVRRQTTEEKEPFGPGCRDYFWLVCRLVDNVKKEDAEKSWEEVGYSIDFQTVNTENLCPQNLLFHMSQHVISIQDHCNLQSSLQSHFF